MGLVRQAGWRTRARVCVCLCRVSDKAVRHHEASLVVNVPPLAFQASVPLRGGRQLSDAGGTKHTSTQKRSRVLIDISPKNIACLALFHFLAQLELLPVSLVTERQSMAAPAAAIYQTLLSLIH